MEGRVQDVVVVLQLLQKESYLCFLLILLYHHDLLDSLTVLSVFQLGCILEKMMVRMMTSLKQEWTGRMQGFA